MFQPIVSPNGALVIYWTGRMDRPEGEWLFVDGGAPVLAENRRDSERGFAFEEAREVFRDVPVGEAGFESAAIRWGPDGDAFAVWEAAWTGERPRRRGPYPDRGRVYLTRATDPRGLTEVHAIDVADVPQDSSVVDVKVDGTGMHLALTARKPIARRPVLARGRAVPRHAEHRRRGGRGGGPRLRAGAVVRAGRLHPRGRGQSLIGQ